MPHNARMGDASLPHLHRRNAGNRFEFPLHLVLAEMAEFVERLRSGEAESQNRIERWIVMQQERTLCALGKTDAIDLLAHFLRDEVHVGLPLKFEDDVRLRRF